MWRYISTTFIASLMAGCASLPAVTSSEIEQELVRLSKVENSQPADEHVYAWFQPNNIEFECKVWLSETDQEQIEEVYWDGECTDGFAIGLGRVFLAGEGWAESIVLEVSAPKTPGHAYYFVDYSDYVYAFINTNINELANSSRQLVQVNVGSGESDLKATFADVVAIKDRESVEKLQNIDSSMTYYRARKGNFSYIAIIRQNLDSDVHKTYLIQHQQEVVGYYQQHYWNGEVHSYAVGTNEEVILPVSFGARFDQMIETFERLKPEIDRTVEVAQEKIVAYRKRICIEDKSPISSISDTQYFNICMPGGELANYESLIKSKVNRTAQQEAKERDKYIQMVRNREANAFSWSKAFLAFAKAIEQGGNAMRPSSSYTPVSNYQAPQVQMPQYFQQIQQPLYEYRSNPLNSLDISQTLVDIKKSGSGRTVCVYSSGSTKVMPYGSVVCPQTYP